MTDYLQEFYELIWWAEQMASSEAMRVTHISMPIDKYMKIVRQAQTEGMYLFTKNDFIQIFGINLGHHHPRAFEGTEIIMNYWSEQ